MAKILIAEDERDIRELIEFTLMAYAGHEVLQSGQRVEAVELAPKVMPDLIMMDVRMPRMTGYEACRELKKIDSGKDIRCLPVAKGQEFPRLIWPGRGRYDYIRANWPDQLHSRGRILQEIQQEP